MSYNNYVIRGMHLGYPLDQLLHRDCRVLLEKRDEERDIGILFPCDDNPGSGNVVIMGPPGSGKSTLGLHIARACAVREENRCYSAYFSLECSPLEVLTKVKMFWEEKNPKKDEKDWRIAASLPLVVAGSAPVRPEELLYRLLVAPDTCPIGQGGAGADCGSCVACAQRFAGSRENRHSWPESAKDPKVLLMSLAPRPTTGVPNDHTQAFWTRYAQLERLLAAAFELRRVVTRKDGDPEVANWILPLVVIDSLNMMAEGMPSRDQLLPLFHLFRKYETTGVFLVESSTPTPFDSTLADVVIRLTLQEDQGYSGRYFEVVKSRYRNQINGRHPYKTVAKPKKDPSGNEILRPPIPRKWNEKTQGRPSPSGIVVLPSVHYAVLRGFFPLPKYGQDANKTPDVVVKQRERAWGLNGEKPGTYWGVSVLNDILPNSLGSGSTVLVEGPGGTYKTNLAATFLAAGLCKGERVLLVRLHDDRMVRPVKETGENGHVYFKADGPALSNDCDVAEFRWDSMRMFELRASHRNEEALGAANAMAGAPSAGDGLVHHSEESGEPKGLGGTAGEMGGDRSGDSWQELAPELKATITVWEMRPVAPSGASVPSDDAARLYEIDFKTGHLLAEEFIQYVRDIVIRQPPEHPITRVVLDDVSEIGVAYPFLRGSSTSGDILLPSLVHLMKDNHVDLVVTGTTGIHPLADDAVARVRAVADTVLRSRYVDVFGRKHVVIEGEGQVASAQTEDVESRSVPAIIENDIQQGKPRRFKVSRERLRGLVGFDQGRLHRPGISLQLFQEHGRVHRRYNSHLLALVRAAFVSPEGLESRYRPHGRPGRSSDQSAVALTTFGPELSAAVHDGLEIFKQAEPMNVTVVCSVDEWSSDDGVKRQFVPMPDLVRSGVAKTSTLVKKKPDGSDELDKESLFSYYGNVLLLAYRTDVLKFETAEIKSWQDLAKKLLPLLTADRLKEKQLSNATPFAWDRIADETLTCAFLDAIWPPGNRKLTSLVDLLDAVEEYRATLAAPANQERGLVNASGKTGKYLAELEDFAAVFGMGKARQGNGGGKSKPRHRDGKPGLMRGNAAVYLCWYSQLRELIDRCPELAPHLNVVALPHGGFRGDWNVGLRRGSVSANLGRAVLSKLLDKTEDYERFMQGVGLPCHMETKEVAEHFLAWPSASKDITLDKVLAIHERARLRIDLTDYKKGRPAIYSAARQLVYCDEAESACLAGSEPFAA